MFCIAAFIKLVPVWFLSWSLLGISSHAGYTGVKACKGKVYLGTHTSVHICLSVSVLNEAGRRRASLESDDWFKGRDEYGQLGPVSVYLSLRFLGWPLKTSFKCAAVKFQQLNFPGIRWHLWLAATKEVRTKLVVSFFCCCCLFAVAFA